MEPDDPTPRGAHFEIITSATQPHPPIPAFEERLEEPEDSTPVQRPGPKSKKGRPNRAEREIALLLSEIDRHNERQGASRRAQHPLGLREPRASVRAGHRKGDGLEPPQGRPRSSRDTSSGRTRSRSSEGSGSRSSWDSDDDGTADASGSTGEAAAAAAKATDRLDPSTLRPFLHLQSKGSRKTRKGRPTKRVWLPSMPPPVQHPGPGRGPSRRSARSQDRSSSDRDTSSESSRSRSEDSWSGSGGFGEGSRGAEAAAAAAATARRGSDRGPTDPSTLQPWLPLHKKGRHARGAWRRSMSPPVQDPDQGWGPGDRRRKREVPPEQQRGQAGPRTVVLEPPEAQPAPKSRKRKGTAAGAIPAPAPPRHNPRPQRTKAAPGPPGPAPPASSAAAAAATVDAAYVLIHMDSAGRGRVSSKSPVRGPSRRQRGSKASAERSRSGRGPKARGRAAAKPVVFPSDGDVEEEEEPYYGQAEPYYASMGGVQGVGERPSSDEASGGHVVPASHRASDSIGMIPLRPSAELPGDRYPGPNGPSGGVPSAAAQPAVAEASAAAAQAGPAGAGPAARPAPVPWERCGDFAVSIKFLGDVSHFLRSAPSEIRVPPTAKGTLLERLSRAERAFRENKVVWARALRCLVEEVSFALAEPDWRPKGTVVSAVASAADEALEAFDL